MSEGGDSGTPHLDLVPILDAMTGVIFFLILSSVFIQLTKLTIPPAETKPVSGASLSNPISGRMNVVISNESIKLFLIWHGDQPGNAQEEVRRGENDKKRIREAAQKLVEEFNTKFPSEKTMQIALTKNGTYQDLIAVMDGVRRKFSDMVLVSYANAAGPADQQSK
jgi:biopolymer transport protein ExbD